MKNKTNQRRGFTLTELVVAASLLVGVMAMVAPLTVRSGRLWQDARHQQLAMDELSNQLERLTSLDPDARRAALAQLTPSEFLTAALPSATIEAETVRDEHGTRLVLSLRWDRPAAQPRPSTSVTLVGWLDPLPSAAQPTSGLRNTEPTALAAGDEVIVNQAIGPEASVLGSQERSISSAQPGTDAK